MVLKKAIIDKNLGQFLIFRMHKNHFGAFKKYRFPGSGLDACIQLVEVSPSHTFS